MQDKDLWRAQTLYNALNATIWRCIWGPQGPDWAPLEPPYSDGKDL